MKKLGILVIFLLAMAVGAATAQTAKVIALSPDEAKEAKSLHDQMDQLLDRMQKFDNKVRIKYLVVDPKDTANQGHTGVIYIPGIDSIESPSDEFWTKPGWNGGRFTYSDDFKFIVPSESPSLPTPPCPNCGVFNLGQGYTVAPAGMFSVRPGQGMIRTDGRDHRTAIAY